MIGTIVGVTALAGLGLYLNRRLFPKMTAPQTISKLTAEINDVVAHNSMKIEAAIAGELDVMSASAGTVVRRIETIVGTGSVSKEVETALNNAGKALKDAVAHVESAFDADKLHNV